MSHMSLLAIEGTSWALPRSDEQGLEKLTRMRATRSGTAEKTRNTSLGWHSLYRKQLLVVSYASLHLQQTHLHPDFSETTQHHSHSDLYINLRPQRRGTQTFYEQLDSIITKTPKKDILVFQGDQNGRVGPDAYQNWAGTLGRFEKQMTENGDSQSWESHQLTLAKTLHRHKLSRTATWHGMPLMSRFTIRQTSS